MLLAASESAVTKKPRLRLTIRRSSSVRPLGSFHVAMSRDMLISCGIQWFEHVARYFSHAHLYLTGTSWLTSVLPLMMRLSAATTRRVSAEAATAAAACAAFAGVVGTAVARAGATSGRTDDEMGDEAGERSTAAPGAPGCLMTAGGAFAGW